MGVEWFVTRDGRRLAGERRGEGTPVVLFESGMGASRREWAVVVPLLAERTSTLVYDRSGLGESPADPAPRDLARLADDEVDLIDALGDAPVVLVAHSWGGVVARAAAAQRPDRVAGLVLVDQTDEGCDLYVRDGAEQQERRFARLLPTIARLGLLRWYAGHLARSFPSEDRAFLRTHDGSVAQARTHAQELATCTADLRRLRDEPMPAPAVPTTLITGTKPSRGSATQRNALLAAHRARAEAAPQGRHVEATASGHMVPFTEPDLIAAEVLRVVDQVATRR